MPPRLVVLVSGAGTLLQALLDAQSAGTLAAQVVAVGSDRPDAHGLVRATNAGIPTFVQPLRPGDDRAAWDRALTEAVARYRPDLVISAGFMKLVGAAFLERYAGAYKAEIEAFLGGVRDGDFDNLLG